jgi:ABC-2 type transport system ATP-binding protein
VITIALGDIPDARIEETLELVGLTERAHSQYKTYSLGMKQRLGIASTLVRNPDIVILDEPTNGLDPAGTREVRQLIPRLAEQGRAVFLCSHLLREVQEVSDRVAIVQRGKLVAEGRVDDLLGQGRYLRLRSNNMDALARELSSIAFVSSISRVDGYFRAEAPQEQAAQLNEMLSARGVYLSEITPWQQDLEDYFLEMTGSEASL